MRRKIKAMSYGLAYGLSRVRPVAAAGHHAGRGARRRWTSTSSGSAACATTCARSSTEARGTGYTETMLGRRRYLPDLTSDNRQRREMAERMALNAPIQGSAADIIKVAMLRVDRALRAGGPARRGCCCRSTTSSSSRWRRASATPVEALVRERDGRRLRAHASRSTSRSASGATWDEAAH